MNFFERQATARRTSRRWVFLFVIAVVAIVAAVDTVMVAALTFYRDYEQAAHARYATTAPFDNGGVILWTTIVVVAVIAMASLYKLSVLRAGGSAVALAAGGRRIERATPNAAEKRLLNVVEEMAIASGVPMPEVYVLEHETGINAFAAGHAPANAAIAVTRAIAFVNSSRVCGSLKAWPCRLSMLSTSCRLFLTR